LSSEGSIPFLRQLLLEGGHARRQQVGGAALDRFLAGLLARQGQEFRSLIPPGGRPYLPRATSMVAWARFCQRPNLTLSIACVPTICEVGVTSGIQPSASRTTGTSAMTSAKLAILHLHFPKLVPEVAEHPARVPGR
jgi:hypothetical protein